MVGEDGDQLILVLLLQEILDRALGESIERRVGGREHLLCMYGSA